MIVSSVSTLSRFRRPRESKRFKEGFQKYFSQRVLISNLKNNKIMGGDSTILESGSWAEVVRKNKKKSKKASFSPTKFHPIRMATTKKTTPKNTPLKIAKRLVHTLFEAKQTMPFWLVGVTNHWTDIPCTDINTNTFYFRLVLNFTRTCSSAIKRWLGETW